MKTYRRQVGWLVFGCLIGLVAMLGRRSVSRREVIARTEPAVGSVQPDRLADPFPTEPRPADQERPHLRDVKLPGNPLASKTGAPVELDVIDSRDLPVSADGRATRLRLISTSMKYPLLRIEETVTPDHETRQRALTQGYAMVADHILVKLHADSTEDDLAALNQKYGATIRKRLSGGNMYLVAFNDVTLDTVPKKIEAYTQEAELVSYAEPDYVVYANQRFPNDPRFGELWGMHNTGQSGGTADADIDAPEAWQTSVGTDVIVAVIDTGVDYNHEDLADNMWTNPGEIPDNGIDDDGNGYVDDIHGIDTVNSDADPKDDHDHGTHCSGTIAGVGDNGIGVVGVCWDARVMALKFLSAGGYGYISDAVECVDYAVMMGARVMNNSWGGGGYSQAMHDSIEAANASNVLFCAAAGNSALNNDSYPHYPSSYTNANVVAVAACTRTDTLSYFSCYGATSVDLAAPGSSILSCLSGDRYASWNGTSMATPHVSGAATLLLSRNPQLTVAEVKAALMDAVDPVAAFNGKMVTGGRLNVANALKAVYGISFGAGEYFAGSWADISLIDSGLAGAGTQLVQVVSSAGDSESLALVEQGSGSEFFTNRIWIAYGAPVVSNSVAEGVHGTELIASYFSPSLGSVVTGKTLVNLSLEIAITTPATDVPYATTNIQLTGVNNGNVHVDMTVSNAATGDVRAFVATNGWTAPAVPLATDKGKNTIWVLGTNSYGQAASDSVVITRMTSSGTNYVAAAGSHAWPFDSWATAATNITAALDVAATSNVVLVADGTYNEGEIIVDRTVTLRSLNGAAAAILDGDDDHRCLSITTDATVEGFTITRGWGEIGAGVYMRAGELRNCVVINNEAWDYGGGVYCEQAGDIIGCTIATNEAYDGGGIEFDHGGMVSNSTIRSNTAWRYGGGVDCYGSGTVYHCEITLNMAWSYGGGVECWSGGKVYNSRITDNTSDYDGGGVECFYGTGIELNNCLISGNDAWGYGGGVDCWGGGTLNNCTVIGNTAAYGGGVYAYYSADVRNSILYHNTAPQGANVYTSGAGITYAHSCIYPSESGTGNITNSPLVTGIDNPHLLTGSACVDAGNNAYASGEDIDDEVRISGGTVDIGCDEWVVGGFTGALQVAISASATNVAVGYVIEANALIDGRASSFGWDFGDGTLVTNVAVVPHSWSTAGDYPVVLSAFNLDYPGGVSATVTVHVASGLTYVSPSGGHAYPYGTWATAATNIQDAIDAVPYGGSVVVTDGVYSANSYVKSGITNRIGLYKPITVRSVNGPASTMIVGKGPRGNGAIRCAYLSDGSVLSGFTLTNGHTRTSGNTTFERSGGGAFLDYGGVLTNCIVVGSKASYRGGGVFCYNGGLVTHTTISGNEAQSYAGGIYSYYGGDIRHCTITTNRSFAYAGGVYCYYGGSISDSVVRWNAASWYGGGIRCTRDTSVDNCLVQGNTAGTRGGGIYGYYGGDVRNCTVVENTAGSGGGGVYFTSYVKAYNTIIYSNTAPSSANCYNTGSSWGYSYCCTIPNPGGTGNTTNRPVFRDTYRLHAISPCIDAGLNQAWMSGGVDLEGAVRIFNGTVDMGAYEFVDTDGDGIPDYWETANGTDPGVSDGGADGEPDGASNLEEYLNYTDPANPDTDGDGFTDGDELTAGTDPLDPANFPAAAVVITGPTAGATYSTTNSTVDLSGTVDHVGAVTNLVIRNSRDVVSFTCAIAANWNYANVPIYSGANVITVTSYDTQGNTATDTLTVTRTGDDDYEDLLRSGHLVQELTFPDNLTPGATAVVRWKVLSYVPVVSRVYAGVPGSWYFFKQGTYTGYQQSPWNLNGRHAGIYSFECQWPVPQKSGDFKVWLNVAQVDHDQYMIPVIPDNVDTRPDPVYAKLVERTILAGGNGTDPVSDADQWSAPAIFETEGQHRQRSAVTVTSITVPDNVVTGSQVTCTWKVQSYVDVDSQIILLNLAQSKAWVVWNAARVGSPVKTTYNFKDRVSGNRYYAYEYSFRAIFDVAAPPGDHQIFIRNRKRGDGSSAWMSGNMSFGIDSRPVSYNGMYGRFIERTVKAP